MALVVVVVLVFLQGWRPAIIPIVAIPVSLVGTFAAMAALGYGINNLTLFGLVLAVGIVVDDAIVVVENVERHLAHGYEPARRGAQDHGGGRRRAGLDRAGAVRGVRADRVSRWHYRTILPAIRRHHRGRDRDLLLLFADAVAGTGLADPYFRTRRSGRRPRWNLIARGWEWFTGLFNRGFDWLSHFYADAAGFVIRYRVVMLLIYVA